MSRARWVDRRRVRRGKGRSALRPRVGRTLCLSVAVWAGCPCRAQVCKDLGPAPIGTSAGRISAIAASRTDPNRYFVAGADGGVWRTLDGGTTWTPLTDQLPTTAIGSLAIDPTDPSVIYAGSGEANFANHSRYGLGIYKSVTGGDSWAQLAAGTFGGRCVSRIVVDFQSPARVYASVTHAGGFPEMAAAKGHPWANGPRGVFRSDDGGQTWTQLLAGLPNQDATDLVMDALNPAVLYAAIGRIFGATENGIYKSTDHGDTWTKLAGGLPAANVGRISLDIAPTNSSRLYTLIAHSAEADGNGGSTLGAYRSDDGGATWSVLPVGSMQASYGWYLNVVRVSPASPDTVFLGGYDILRSTNGGSSWSTVTAPHVDNHALAFDASGRVLVGDDGGLHRSSNLGGSWAGLNAGLATAQFYPGLSTHPSNGEIILGGNQDNGCNERTTDSRTWTGLTGGDGGWTQIDQTNPQRLFTESQGTGSLYRSTNGGASFSSVGAGLSGRNCFLPPYLIDPTNPQRMLYGTERVYRSTDGGTTFTALSADLTGGGSASIRALEIAPSDPGWVYAATNDGRILASSDGGATFALRLSGVAGWPRTTREITADPTDAHTVYLAGAVFGAPHVRRSRDAGATWQTLDGDLPDLPVNTVACDPRPPAPVLYAGTDAGLYRSVDDGNTWRPYGAGLPRAQVVDVRVEPARSRIIVGTMGRGAWSVPILSCYADFDDNGQLNVNDFAAFLNGFAAGSAQANCDQSTSPPVLNVLDFSCFLNAFAAGCS